MRVIKMVFAIFHLALVTFSQERVNTDFDKDKMDRLFSVIEENEKGMGSISIFTDGEAVYENAFGYANIAQEIPATLKTKYRIGSISKTFTASIIMQLVQEGDLQMDAKLSEFFPEVKNSDKITIEQLLKHRSGIFNFTSADDYQSYMEQPVTREELLHKIATNGIVFEAGEKAEYSNSNYVLLSLIVEKIEGKDFGNLVKDRICLPCELNDTYYGTEISEARNEARSYTKAKEWKLATETDMSVPMGAGAIVSNPNDLNQFLNCLFNHKLVSEVTLDEMMRLKDGFGIGMFQVPFYDKRAYGHNGGIDGFQSNAYYFPEEKVAISYTTNGVVMAVNDIMIGALSIYFGKVYDFPQFTPAVELTSEDLDQYLGTYSSPTFPLKITITKEGNTLIGQASGQPSFTLEAYEPDMFRFEAAGLKLEFKPTDNKMIIRQGGGEFELDKE